MLPWQIWLIISGVCFILEIATVGFLVFWFGVAALITCLISLFIPNIIVQTVIFIILSVALILLSRPFAKKIGRKDNVVTNSNAIIGKEGIVTKKIDRKLGKVGQVKILGDTWSAICDNSDLEIPVDSTVKVTKIDGVKLIVEPINIKSTSEK